MRAIALGQAFRRVGGVASLCAASCPAALASRAEAAGLVVVRVPEDGDAAARETAARARAIGASWVVVDGYHLGVPARARLRALGLRVLSVDDHGFAGAEEADAILDQNLGATADAYASRSPDTMLLLGPSYALLREEFVAAAPPVRAIGDGPPRRVLLTFGGADPADATSLAIRALADPRLADVRATALVGAGNARGDAIERLAAETNVTVVRDATDMPRRLADAELAIAAAGTTCWELAYMGLPSLLVVLADNQAALAVACDEAGMARSLGDVHAITEVSLANAIVALRNDPAAMRSMSIKGSRLVDGKGGERVARALLESPSALPRSPIAARRAQRTAMDRKQNVLFPVETINRELDDRLLLAVLFARPDRRIFIGQHDLLFALTNELPGGIWVGKNVFWLFPMTDMSRYRALKSRGYTLVHLDEEGAVYTGPPDDWKYFLEQRLDTRRLDPEDLVCLWGEWQAAHHRSLSPPCAAGLRVTGHPRFEHYKPRFRALFHPERDALVRRFGRFVLVNTNLTWANNGRGIADSFARWQGYQPETHAGRMVQIDCWNHANRVLAGILALASRLAEELPDVNIVVRPHPSEDQALYRAVFQDVKNVHVLHEGPVGPWLLAARVVIHDGCTTGIEASLAGRTVINYKPFLDQKQELVLPNLFGTRCKNPEEVLAVVRDAIAGPDRSVELGEVPELARQLMHNFSGDAVDAYLGVMEEASARATARPRYRDAVVRLIAARRSIGDRARDLARRVASFERAREGLYRKIKFPGLTQEAVESKVQRMAALTGRRVRAEVVSEMLVKVETA